MRHSVLRRLVTVCGTALLSLSMMGASPAFAQKPKPRAPAGGAAKPGGAKPGGAKPGGKPGPGGGGDNSIELDEPATPGAGAQGGAKPAAPSGPPPVAGQMTEQAAQAKRLFDGEKWGDAASALYRVYKGETGDDEGNKQLAQYHLAIALYRLQFYQASYAIFSQIADKPNHLKFNETLLWLAKLATDLPEPADIVERVGKYNDEQIAKFNNSNQRELFWQLNYLLGRYKYRNRQYEDALRLFSKVDRQSKYYIKGQFFGGISNVQLRRSVPAVQSFQRVVGAIDEGVEGIEVTEEERMRDLAYLSMARTYYSASVRLDENNAPTIDSAKLSAAVKYWNKVDQGSEYWLDSLFEESWAYFMAGDYAHALGNVHTIESPYFPDSYYPEGQVLRGVIYFANCQYEDAETIVAQFQQKYQPIYDDLAKVMKRFQGDEADEPFYKFLKQVRDGQADLPPRIKIVVTNALSDRQLLRHLQYVQVLDDEGKRFQKAPAAFRDSPLGNDVKDSLQLARDIAVRNAGQLARERYQRNLDELNEHLRDSAKIMIDVTSAKRNQLDAAIAGSQVTVQESERNIVKPDEEHVIWPFDGEYWRDELGFYRQTITSKCGR
jgi:tetratricopeptide (TPR) repeat protein